VNSSANVIWHRRYLWDGRRRKVDSRRGRENTEQILSWRYQNPVRSEKLKTEN
jgi:hypothetical protein